MKPGRQKTTKLFYFSVEGSTEQWYLEWLCAQINKEQAATANVRFVIKQCRLPSQLVKSYLVGHTLVIHLCDYEEDTHEQETAFRTCLGDMQKQKGVNFIFGYSNFTFDLWIILHNLPKEKLSRVRVDSRNHYLEVINQTFSCSFSQMEAYKRERNFKQKILGRLSLDSVRNAISCADAIMEQRKRTDTPVKVGRYAYYPAAPSTALGHDVVAMILNGCGLKARA